MHERLIERTLFFKYHRALPKSPAEYFLTLTEGISFSQGSTEVAPKRKAPNDFSLSA